MPLQKKRKKRILELCHRVRYSRSTLQSWAMWPIFALISISISNRIKRNSQTSTRYRTCYGSETEMGHLSWPMTPPSPILRMGLGRGVAWWYTGHIGLQSKLEAQLLLGDHATRKHAKDSWNGRGNDNLGWMTFKCTSRSSKVAPIKS